MYVCVCVRPHVCGSAAAQTDGVRICICVCVRGSAAAQTDASILMKLSTNDLTDICEVCFLQIIKFQNRWRHGCLRN